MRPKLLKQHKTDPERYPLAPISAANRSTLQPLFSITFFSGKHLLTLVLCHSSMFSSHGQVNSMRITLFSLLEKIVMSGFVRWKKKKVPSRSPNKTQSDTWRKIPLGEEFLFLTLVPFFRKFHFYGLLWSKDCRFDVSNERSYIGNIILTALSWQKVNLLWLKATLHAPRIWDVVQISLLHRKQEGLVASFHLLRLLGEGKVS